MAPRLCNAHRVSVCQQGKALIVLSHLGLEQGPTAITLAGLIVCPFALSAVLPTQWLRQLPFFILWNNVTHAQAAERDAWSPEEVPIV